MCLELQVNSLGCQASIISSVMRHNQLFRLSSAFKSREQGSSSAAEPKDLVHIIQ